MVHKLDARLHAIETALAGSPVNAQVLVDAQAFDQSILGLADRFQAADSALSAAERKERFSPAMELAWLLRFGTDSEVVKAIDRCCDLG